MESDDSAPEDVPIASKPVDDMFNKRLTAKKIQQDKKLILVQKNTKAVTQLKPLPLEVIDQLSQEIPNTVLPIVKKSQKERKKKTLKLQKKGINNKNLQTYDLKKLPDFIPLDNVPAKCSTKFKVGVLDAIVKNPIGKNHKEYVLFHSKRAQRSRTTNVKDNIVKKALIKRMNAER